MMASTDKPRSFRVNDELYILLDAAAKKKGFGDVSAFIRLLVQQAVDNTFTTEQQKQILSLLAPEGGGDFSQSETPATQQVTPHQPSHSSSGERRTKKREHKAA